MNTETATSPELAQHVDNLHRDACAVTEDLKQEAKARFQDVKEQVGSKIQDVKQQAGDQLQNAKEQAAAQFQKAKVTAKDVADTLRGYVAEHPYAAFGAGIFVGLFLASRARR